MQKVSDVHVILGQRIRARRHELGLSQQRAAYESGLDVSYYGRIERGEANPSVANLFRIAERLETTAAELVAGLTYADVPHERGRGTR